MTSTSFTVEPAATLKSALARTEEVTMTGSTDTTVPPAASIVIVNVSPAVNFFVDEGFSFEMHVRRNAVYPATNAPGETVTSGVMRVLTSAAVAGDATC